MKNEENKCKNIKVIYGKEDLKEIVNKLIEEKIIDTLKNVKINEK